MDPRITSLAAIFELNTDLLLNCLDGLSQGDAQRRLDGGGNSIIFLAAHLADTRHFLLGRLGHPLANPLSRYLADAQSIEDGCRRSWVPSRAARSSGPQPIDSPSATPRRWGCSPSWRSMIRITWVRPRSSGASWASRR